jgi:xanthine dehydrogenase accessory factor
MAVTESERRRAGTPAVMGRVIDLKGFSTLPVDEMVVIDADGEVHGDLLGRPGAEALGRAARDLLAGGRPRLETVAVEIHGRQVAELGLSCGGRADVLLQPMASVPAAFWAAVDARRPVALVTVVDGPGSGPAALAVGPTGEVWGGLEPAAPPELAAALASEAAGLLAERRTARRRVELAGHGALVETWVPHPRLVVVGSGEIVAAIAAQAGLLGWESRSTEQIPAGSDPAGPAPAAPEATAVPAPAPAGSDPAGPETAAPEPAAPEATAGPAPASADLAALLDWAGATGALVVCSHDPHVDAPALAAGLRSGCAYVGAMGSRGTQSRRLERLRALGVAEEDLARIHRPIGLDLGGRRAPEVALSIVAEILASHHGRSGRSLSGTSGPIHG